MSKPSFEPVPHIGNRDTPIQEIIDELAKLEIPAVTLDLEATYSLDGALNDQLGYLGLGSPTEFVHETTGSVELLRNLEFKKGMLAGITPFHRDVWLCAKAVDFLTIVYMLEGEAEAFLGVDPVPSDEKDRTTTGEWTANVLDGIHEDGAPDRILQASITPARPLLFNPSLLHAVSTVALGPDGRRYSSSTPYVKIGTLVADEVRKHYVNI